MNKKKTTRKQRQKKQQPASASQQTEEQKGSGQIEETVTWFILDVLKPRAGSITISIVVVIALISGGFFWQQHQKSVKAEALAEVNNTDKISELKQLSETYKNSKAGERSTYKLAVQQYQNEKFSAAAETFRKFIDQYSKSALINKAKLGSAYAIEADGRYLQAMESFEQLAQIKNLPPILKTEAYVGAGRTAKELDKRDKAVKFYNRATSTTASGFYKEEAETALRQLKAYKL